MIDKSEKITSKNLIDIKNEIKKIDIIIDDSAIRNVNKYLSAIKETFDFLTSHFKGLSVKNLEKNKKILEEAYNKKDLVFIDKIQTILKTLGNINSYAMKENFDSMNILAWCYNVFNLKAYHTSISDFDPISTELEKKVVSILNRYKPAQRNSYDAYHLVEDFIEICRDQTGEIKLSHQISDLMLIEVLKDFMKKTNDEINNLLRTSNKTTKVGIVDVTRDETGNITQINNDKTDRQRRLEVEKMIANQFETTDKARKFFFDLYNGLITFNGKSWNSLSQEVQNSILKAAKIDKSSSEYLDIKLNRRIEKNTGVSPIVRETEITAKKSNISSLISNENAIKFINKMMNLNGKQIESLKDTYGQSRFVTLKEIVQQYGDKGIIKEKLKEVFDKPLTDGYKFVHKLAELDKAFRLVSPNGSTRVLFIESNETPLLNKYLEILNENK